MNKIFIDKLLGTLIMEKRLVIYDSLDKRVKIPKFY